MKKRDYFAVLCVFLVLGALPRILYYHFSVGSDDQRWIISAREFGGERASGLLPAYYNRTLFRLLLHVWAHVFPLSLATTVYIGVGFALLTVVLSGELARRIFDERTALAAAAILLADPINITFDWLTVPDNLAIVLTLASALCFVWYINSARLRDLALAGFLAGLSFSAKEYMVIVAAPFALVLLTGFGTWAHKVRLIAFMSVFVILGLSIDFLLHYCDSGDALGHFRALGGYSGRLASIAPPNTLVARISERGYYPSWLLEHNTINAGLYLIGFFYMVGQSRRREDCRLVSATVVVFGLFLAAMPVSVRPLLFVEAQPRYLMVLTPFLAVGAGRVLTLVSQWSAANDQTLRMAIRLGLCVALFLNVFYYSYWIEDVASAPEFVGIERTLQSAGRYGFTELVLPPRYQQRLPDRYYAYGVRFSNLERDKPPFRDTVALPVLLDGADDFLENRARTAPHGCAVFLPIIAPTEELKAKFAARSFDYVAVKIPRDSIRSWMEFLGVKQDRQGRVVGSLFVRRAR